MSARRGRVRVALTALAVACGPGRPSAPAPEPCVLAGGTPQTDTVVFGLVGAVDPARAPQPATDAERVLFGQLYETLVRVDCAGSISAGLAESWSSDEGGRRWTFRLRGDATFWDGTPVTADAVRASWRAGEARAIAPWRDSVFGSVRADDRTLEVSLRSPVREPAVFAHPSLAVARNGDRWPLGTGSHAITSVREAIVAAPRSGVRRDALPTLVFRLAANARDLLDGGADLVIVRERAIVDYAAKKQDFRVAALPWDQTYLLALPGVPQDGGGRGFERLVAAVGVDARAPAGPAWWRAGRCRDAAGAEVVRGGRARIVYPAGDSTARRLAERLVALGTSGELNGMLSRARDRLSVAGLEDGRFAEALAVGRELAYVFPVPRGSAPPMPPAPCRPWWTSEPTP